MNWRRPTRGADAVKGATLHSIDLGGRTVEYHLVRSRTARKVRVRVGISGVEVVQPNGRGDEEVKAFLHANAAWIVGQLDRMEGFRKIRRPQHHAAGELLFRGTPTPIRVDELPGRGG